MTINTERLKTDAAYWDEVAPEGATHFNGNGAGSQWWMKDGQCMYQYRDDKWIERLTWPMSLIPRPQAPEAEWVDGVPPVGCECERLIGNDVYRVVVVAHFNDEVVVYQEDAAPEYTGVQAGYLRPIPSKAQRDRDELSDLIHSHLGPECNIDAATDAILSRYNLEPKL